MTICTLDHLFIPSAHLSANESYRHQRFISQCTHFTRFIQAKPVWLLVVCFNPKIIRRLGWLLQGRFDVCRLLFRSNHRLRNVHNRTLVDIWKDLRWLLMSSAIYLTIYIGEFMYVLMLVRTYACMHAWCTSLWQLGKLWLQWLSQLCSFTLLSLDSSLSIHKLSTVSSDNSTSHCGFP